MIDVYERLIEHWRACGVESNAGNGGHADVVAAFEARYGVIVPPDFKEYLQRVNGMRETNESDDHFIAFHDLSRFETFENEPTLFTFADWSIECHFYAVRLLPELQNTTPVYVFYDPAQQIAKGLEEFFSRYLEGDGEMLFPKVA